MVSLLRWVSLCPSMVRFALASRHLPPWSLSLTGRGVTYFPLYSEPSDLHSALVVSCICLLESRLARRTTLQLRRGRQRESRTQQADLANVRPLTALFYPALIYDTLQPYHTAR